MTTITDSFNRSNESPLASPWTTGGVDDSAFELISNLISRSSATLDATAVYNTTWGNDQSSKAKLYATATGGGQGIGLWVRHAASAKTGYRLITDHSGSNNCELAKFSAGSFTLLVDFTQAWTDGDTWELRIVGTTITIWLNSTQLSFNSGSNTLTDTSVASGLPGIAHSSNTTIANADDWTGTDAFGGGGPTVKPLAALGVG